MYTIDVYIYLDGYYKLYKTE